MNGTACASAQPVWVLHPGTELQHLWAWQQSCQALPARYIPFLQKCSVLPPPSSALPAHRVTVLPPSHPILPNALHQASSARSQLSQLSSISWHGHIPWPRHQEGQAGRRLEWHFSIQLLMGQWSAISGSNSSYSISQAWGHVLTEERSYPGKQISLGLKIFSAYSAVCLGKGVSLASLPLLIQILLIIWSIAKICPDAAVIWDSPNKSHRLVNEALPLENSSNYLDWSKAHSHVQKWGLSYPIRRAQVLLRLLKALQKDRDCLQINRGLLFVSTLSFFSNKPVVIINHDCFEWI